MVQIPQGEITYYPQRNLTFSSTPAGWSVTHAWGIPYRDILGNWWLRISMRLGWTGNNNFSFTINGVSFASGTNQGLSGWTAGPVIYALECGNGTGTVYVSGSYNCSMGCIQGDVRLASQPMI
jgi:hypothetical protein